MNADPAGDQTQGAPSHLRLNRLVVNDVRCIGEAQLQLSPGTNLIVGPNGSGKTSLLEAVWLLGTARSFRTSRAAELIRHGSERLCVSAQLTTSGGLLVSAGLERTPVGASIRFNGRPLTAASALARELPMVVFGPDSHNILQRGPHERRRMLDWLLFHVKHDYLDLWSRYHRALKQRNQVLRTSPSRSAALVWEAILESAGTELHTLRQCYLAELSQRLTAAAEAFGLEDAALDYSPGWDTSQGLGTMLESTWAADCEAGSTREGPHRAELHFRCGGRPAARVSSRGQAKLMVAALAVAQTEVILSATGRAPIMLIDDPAAELDPRARERLMCRLERLPCQRLVTAVEGTDLPPLGSGVAVFHVEQGVVQETPRRSGTQ